MLYRLDGETEQVQIGSNNHLRDRGNRPLRERARTDRNNTPLKESERTDNKTADAVREAGGLVSATTCFSSEVVREIADGQRDWALVSATTCFGSEVHGLTIQVYRALRYRYVCPEDTELGFS